MSWVTRWLMEKWHGDINTRTVPRELLIWMISGELASMLRFLPPYTVYPKKYAHGFCFAVLCCGYTLTDFPISIRLTSLALWQSNDCPSASKATLMNMDTYFMWIHYERLHNHNKAKHNKTVCIFLGIYCMLMHGVSGRCGVPVMGEIIHLLPFMYALVVHPGSERRDYLIYVPRYLIDIAIS